MTMLLNILLILMTRNQKCLQFNCCGPNKANDPSMPLLFYKYPIEYVLYSK